MSFKLCSILAEFNKLFSYAICAYSSFQSDNAAAIAMYKEQKFVVTDHLPAHYFFNNAYHDALRLELCFPNAVDNRASKGEGTFRRPVLFCAIL